MHNKGRHAAEEEAWSTQVSLGGRREFLAVCVAQL